MLLEELGLGDGVLAGGGVHHQDAPVRAAGVVLGQDPLDLFQLLHEVGLGVQPSRGVDEEQIVALRPGPVQGLVGHGRWIRSGGLGIEAHSHALGPDLELFDGRGPKGVPRGDEGVVPLHAGPVGQLGDGGGLAHPVHAKHEHDFRGNRLDPLGRRGEHRGQLLLEELLEFLGRGGSALPDPSFQGVHQGGRGLEPYVRGDEDLLQLLPELLPKVVAAAEKPVDASGELVPGLGQAAGELLEEPVALVLLVLQV